MLRRGADTCSTALAVVKTMAIEAESVALEADIKKMCDVEVWREKAWSKIRVLIFF